MRGKTEYIAFSFSSLFSFARLLPLGVGVLLGFGQPAWFAEDLWSICDASAFAAKKARPVDELGQFIGVLPNVTLGPVAESFRHVRTKRGMAGCASGPSAV